MPPQSSSLVRPSSDRAGPRGRMRPPPVDTGITGTIATPVDGRATASLELFVPLRRDHDVPLHRQLEQHLRDAVRDGRLAANATVPSTRALATQLDVARGVVVEAYEQLIAEGYLVSRPGGSTRVARLPGLERRVSDQVAGSVPEFDFRPGRPALDDFPRAAWLRSMRRALTSAPAERLGYLDGRGVPELRATLSSYLDRVRGTATTADEMVISTGFAQGLSLVANALHARGMRRVGVEDPWQVMSRATLTRSRLEVVPIPVDDEGIVVDRLEDAGVHAVVVTPAHQYPTGAVMAPERRFALMDWACRRGAFIIEDDYDAEFRYDREPIGALQGLCPERVVYAGTASKTLAPGLRLAWLAVPRSLVDGVASAKTTADLGSGALDQLALADFIEHGELDRHLRRMRAIYRRRRDALLSGLRRHLPTLRPTGASAGLHVLTWLPREIDDAGLVDAAAERGVTLQAVSGSYMEPPPRGGIVFGYGSIAEQRIDEGLTRIAALLGDAAMRPMSPAS
jgi:GntR family transcriptional regulator / MocR family aminotransferase